MSTRWPRPLQFASEPYLSSGPSDSSSLTGPIGCVLVTLHMLEELVGSAFKRMLAKFQGYIILLSYI